MIINVTQEYINKGIKGSCSKCPIALAIREQTKYSGVDVCGSSYYESGQTSYALGSLPIEAKKFINKFDYNEEVKPFSFELDI